MRKFSFCRLMATITTVQAAIISSRTEQIKYSEMPLASSRPHSATPAMMPPMEKAIRLEKEFIKRSYWAVSSTRLSSTLPRMRVSRLTWYRSQMRRRVSI